MLFARRRWGEELPPGWTEFSDWVEDLLVPAFQFAPALAVAFGAVIFFQFREPFTGAGQTAANGLAWAWACGSPPILLLGVAMTDSALAVVNPVPLLRAIALTLPTYVVTCLFCALMLGLCDGLNELLDYLPSMPILPDVIASVVQLYLLMTLSRGFGLYYLHNHERLEWY